MGLCLSLCLCLCLGLSVPVPVPVGGPDSIPIFLGCPHCRRTFFCHSAYPPSRQFRYHSSQVVAAPVSTASHRPSCCQRAQRPPLLAISDAETPRSHHGQNTEHATQATSIHVDSHRTSRHRPDLVLPTPAWSSLSRPMAPGAQRQLRSR